MNTSKKTHSDAFSAKNEGNQALLISNKIRKLRITEPEL